ncbi:hypothetical protein WJX77_006297 [Trebouxia sp. C0004]
MQSQANQTVDSYTALRTLTDGSRSYSFRTPLQMRRFIDAGLTHSKTYPSDVAFVLRCLGSADTAGLQRLGEICRFPHAVDAGVNKEACSFQRVTCALLHLVTLPALMNSLLTQCYNPIMATLADNLDLASICRCAKALADQGSIADPNYRPYHQEQDGGMWQPETWVQMLQPIVNFLNQVVQRLLAIKQAEQQRVLRKETHGLQQHVHRQRQQRSGPGRLQADQDGPGETRPDGPRHDNDHTSINSISIAPTQQEVLCHVSAYLPANVPGTVIHLEEGSPEAHKDLHFRLLRHDMVAELCESAVRFQQAGGSDSLALPKGATSGRANLPGIDDDMSLFVYGNVEIKNLMTAKFGAGVQYEVAFDDLPFNTGKTSGQRREYWEKSRRLQHGTLVALWWDRSAATRPRAQQASDPCITFATISMRNEQQLAPREAGHRPQIGIRLCQGCGANDEILMAALGGKLPGHTVMLQSSGSFFAYEPILKALQSTQTMPLADYIAAPKLRADSSGPEPPTAGRTGGASFIKDLLSHGNRLFGNRGPVGRESPPPTAAAARVGGPAYLTQDASFRLDLSCLLDEAVHDDEALNAVKTIDLLAGHWPSDTLQEVTTLDQSQLLALQAALSRELALVQGPPGTGKTYVGIQAVKALLANTSGNAKDLDPGTGHVDDLPNAADPLTHPCVGPVLIVCFTNHALDQFLEGLLAAGLTDMVRVGGRSKNDALAQYNIHELVRDKAMPAQKQLLYGCYNRAGALEQRIGELKASLMQGELAWPAVKHHVEMVAPDLHESLVSRKRPMDDEFEEAVSNKRHFWWQWLHGHRRNNAQNKAAAAADARAQASQVAGHNSFDVLAEQPNFQTTGPPATEVPAAANTEPGEWGEQGVAALAGQRLAGQRLHIAPNRDLEDLLAAEDAWTMTRTEREMLYNCWDEQLRSGWLGELKLAMREYESVRDEQRRIHADVDLNVLKGARLVGMTTAGVANKQELVAAMAPKVVIVEEAGEVFEAHILASLAPTTEHLILIGDHEQLRPKPQLYALQTESGQGYNLDLSLFERLVRQGFPVATLEQQRRMRPSVSRLIRNTIYPSLQDHASVCNYPRVKGMVHNVFFWDHNHPEGGRDENASKQNSAEAAMAARLALYLTQQGYKAGDITILTPYVGQLLLLRAEVRKYMRFVVSERDAEELAAAQGDEDTEGSQDSPAAKEKLPGSKLGFAAEISRVNLNDCVRVATVDNFQGEESTIIILSLVRNNKQGMIGFLKTSNRINVMLSRAKHGMYILGHADTLTASKKSTMWRQVTGLLEGDDAVGQALPVVCANHPESVNMLRSAADFDTFARDGGCSLQCSARMPCGHSCPRLCHPDDSRHVTVQCPKACTHVLQPCGHPCPKLCYQDCGLCTRPMPNLLLPCGHTAHDIPCHRALKPDLVACTEKVSVHLPHCGHTIQVRCGDVAAVQADASKCTATCGSNLECGHTCQHRCGACLLSTVRGSTTGSSKGSLASAPPIPVSSYQHLACSQVCSRDLLCGHTCGKSCHGGSTCPPCTRLCSVKCGHGQCKGLCTDLCAPCAEPCRWLCQHQGQCKLPCGAPCTRLPCNERCTLQLSCGHRCPSVCGEPCPSTKFCIHCGDKSLTAYDIIMDENRTLRDYDKGEVTENPLIVLACGHVLPMTSMDGYLELHRAYAKDQQGNWTTPCQLEAGEQQALKSCPICRQPLTQIMRYGRPLNHMKVQHADIKFFLHCNQELAEADKMYGAASKAASDSASRAAVGEGRQALGRRPAKHSMDATVIGLQHAKHLAEQSARAYQVVQGLRPPTVAVFQAARCAIQSLQDQQLSAASKPVDSVLGALDVPRPDRGPSCKAMIGYCQAVTVWMAASVTILQRLVDLNQQASNPQQQLSAEVKKLWSDANWAYEDAGRHAAEAQKLALQDRAPQTVVQGKVAVIRLQQQRVRDLNSIQSSNTNQLLGTLAISKQAAKKEQLCLVTEAEATCKAAQAQLRWALQGQTGAAGGAAAEARASLGAELKVLSDNFAGLRKLVENQEVSPDEMKTIMKALMKSNADLAGGGYTGHGHFYKCPNGHPYVIGDCGGAAQATSCPECGARIGGTGHQLTSGNTQHQELDRLARQVAGSDY